MQAVALISLFTLILYPIEILAPFPKCSPLRFINKLVESDGLAWLMEGLPGHPVPECDTSHISDLRLEDVSVLAFFLGKPERIGAYLSAEYQWLLRKGIPRLQVGNAFI